MHTGDLPPAVRVPWSPYLGANLECGLYVLGRSADGTVRAPGPTYYSWFSPWVAIFRGTNGRWYLGAVARADAIEQADVDNVRVPHRRAYALVAPVADTIFGEPVTPATPVGLVPAFWYAPPHQTGAYCCGIPDPTRRAANGGNSTLHAPPRITAAAPPGPFPPTVYMQGLAARALDLELAHFAPVTAAQAALLLPGLAGTVVNGNAVLVHDQFPSDGGGTVASPDRRLNHSAPDPLVIVCVPYSGDFVWCLVRWSNVTTAANGRSTVKGVHMVARARPRRHWHPSTVQTWLPAAPAADDPNWRWPEIVEPDGRKGPTPEAAAGLVTAARRWRTIDVARAMPGLCLRLPLQRRSVPPHTRPKVIMLTHTHRKALRAILTAFVRTNAARWRVQHYTVPQELQYMCIEFVPLRELGPPAHAN